MRTLECCVTMLRWYVLQFVDAWKEGDGKRVLRLWKTFMLHFRAENKTKYAHEALRLQFHVATLPPYLFHQLTWGRFINTHGRKGRNLPCYLHNEHINKLFKDILETWVPISQKRPPLGKQGLCRLLREYLYWL